MTDLKEEKIRQAVRERYTEAAQVGGCGCAPSSCCGLPSAQSAAPISLALGYSENDLNAVPEGANLGLGCGNPQAIAALKPGEVVLDLGSGGGFDCFLAARAVGSAGRVIGVDMTPDMISKARENALKGGYTNVEFRLGEIEHLPVADNSIDVILSNCVINLSPDKPQVYADALRALKPGGRIAVSDVLAVKELTPEVKANLSLHAGCIAGASLVSDTEAMLRAAGFVNIRIIPRPGSREIIGSWSAAAGMGIAFEDYVISAEIGAEKELAS